MVSTLFGGTYTDLGELDSPIFLGTIRDLKGAKKIKGLPKQAFY